MTIPALLSDYQQQYAPHIISRARTASCIKRLSAILSGELSDLTHQTLLDYRSQRKAQGVAGSTVNRELHVLSSALAWARRNGKAQVRVDMPLEREKPSTHALAPAEAMRLMEAAPNLKSWAFIKLSLLTGQRKDAILGLRHDQISRGVINFNADGAEMAERRKNRGIIPLTTGIRQVLAKLKAEYGETVYVIPNGDGRHKSLDVSFHKAVKAAGLSHLAWLTPHTLRHSACTILVDAGGTLLEAQKLLGHRSIKTTEAVYLNLNPQYLKNATDILERAIA